MKWFRRKPKEQPRINAMTAQTDEDWMIYWKHQAELAERLGFFSTAYNCLKKGSVYRDRYYTKLVRETKEREAAFMAWGLSNAKRCPTCGRPVQDYYYNPYVNPYYGRQLSSYGIPDSVWSVIFSGILSELRGGGIP